MNLCILLAITWISISVVIADSSWFVQDTPLVEDKSDALFSSEDLLPVGSKPARKQAPATKVKSDKTPRQQVKTKTAKPKTPAAHKTVAVVDVESDELLLVSQTGRKPFQNVGSKGAGVSRKENIDVAEMKTAPEGVKEWFVHDSSAEDEGKDGLFPSEQLMRVDKQKPKPAPEKKPSRNKPQDKKIAQFTKAKSTKEDSKTDKMDAAAEEFLPVQQTRRKPLQVVEMQAQVPKHNANLKSKLFVGEQSQDSKHGTDRKSQPTFQHSSQNAASWFAFGSLSGEQTVSEDLSDENLIRVQTKSKKDSTVKTSSKRTLDKSRPKSKESPKPTVTKKKSLVKVVKSEDFLPADSTGRKPLQLAEQSNQIAPDKNQDAPCESDQDIDCLMQNDNLILVEKKKAKQLVNRKVEPKLMIKQDKNVPLKKELQSDTDKPKFEEVQREALHRRLLDNENTDIAPTKIPLLESLEEVDDLEELPEIEGLLEESHPRFRRQAEDTEVSGDGGFDNNLDITDSVHKLPYSTTFATNLTTLTSDDKSRMAQEFANNTRNQFQSFPGFEEIRVTNVTLDENGRVNIEWGVFINISAVGGNTRDDQVQNTLDFLSNNLVPYINNNITVEGAPVYNGSNLEPNATRATAANILGNPCMVENACPDGFECSKAELKCVHLCYSTDLQCRHGGTCQLDNTFQPYCQCGSGYTGEFCEEEVPEPDYTSGQIAGATTAAAVAGVGACGALFYCFIFRRKKEEDMEYSYFGDDDQGPGAYSDPDTNLGMGNDYYISRPSVNITPLDIYNQDLNGAVA